MYIELNKNKLRIDYKSTRPFVHLAEGFIQEELITIKLILTLPKKKSLIKVIISHDLQ